MVGVIQHLKRAVSQAINSASSTSIIIRTITRSTARAFPTSAVPSKYRARQTKEPRQITICQGRGGRATRVNGERLATGTKVHGSPDDVAPGEKRWNVETAECRASSVSVPTCYGSLGQRRRRRSGRRNGKRSVGPRWINAFMREIHENKRGHCDRSLRGKEDAQKMESLEQDRWNTRKERE